MKKITCCIFTLTLLWSCNTTKNIPEGKYLMSGYTIKSDTKKIDEDYFEEFVRQQPNSTIRLSIHNMAGQDTNKWYNKLLTKKLGQTPVIYNPSQTHISANQIAKELSNQGYLRAEVDTLLKIKGKKMYITYNIHNNGIYTVNNYENTIQNKEISQVLSKVKKLSRIKPSITFDQEELEISRENLTTLLRNIGYYNFSKEYLYFKADTTINSHQVDLFLSLYEAKDSTSFKRFKIRNVNILSGFDRMSRGNEKLFSNPDTVKYKGVNIIYGKNNFLRKSTLYRNNYIRPGKYYSDYAYTHTTGSFNGIGVIKQTDISLTPVPGISKDSTQYLDAQINIAPGNTHFFQTEIQGTNSAGDLGIAPSITYQHQNLFNGAEILKVRLRGAYEFVSDTKDSDLASKNYYEIGGDVSLSFPQFLFPWLKKSWREQPYSSTQISVGMNSQHRKEYTRQFFNTALTYRWTSSRSQLSHALSLFDINYVRMPWTSDSFKKDYLSENSSKVNSMIRESYRDQLISSTKYGITYTPRPKRYSRSRNHQTTIRANIDISGWLPRLVTSLNNTKKDSLGQKEILGIAYAEYIKGDFSISQTHKLGKNTSWAYRIGLGIAQPFGNSDVLPFESRYFSGGANSVRGWATRALGPGSYSNKNDSVNFVNKVGDIKLDMGIEYRNKISEYIELAGFVDAGNIWTIKNYDAQPNSQFKFSEFYKQIALAYGIGFRFDLGFLLLRLDFGARAYDPGRKKGDRWVIHKPSWNKMAWHFGIGYPF